MGKPRCTFATSLTITVHFYLKVKYLILDHQEHGAWPSGTRSLTIRNTEPYLFQCCARYSNIYHGLIHGTDLYGHLGSSEKGSAGLSTSRHLTRSGKSSYASQHRPIFRLPVGHHPGIECSIDEITQLFIAGWFPAFKFHKRYSNSAYDDH